MEDKVFSSYSLPDHLEEELRHLIAELNDSVRLLLSKHNASISISALGVVYAELICEINVYDLKHTLSHLNHMHLAITENAIKTLECYRESKTDG